MVVYLVNVKGTKLPGDLKWRERTETSCQIKVHFSVETTEYLLKYTLFRFQIYVRAIVLINEQSHKISTSFMKTEDIID